MPAIRPIRAICFNQLGGDVSSLIAPPYDVLDEASKQSLLAKHKHNIVKIDLPYTPPKTVGPNAVYDEAGRVFRCWLRDGVLSYRDKPAVFVYQQTFDTSGLEGGVSKTLRRRGVIANVGVQAFGRSPDGRGGIWPHERTIPSGEEDRLRLMRSTRAQTSPIFGMYEDPDRTISGWLSELIESHSPDLYGTSRFDGVRHELWGVEQPEMIEQMASVMSDSDIYIADGHHRYNTALNYLKQHKDVPLDHPARFCMFVLVAIQDPGMIVLPTHRVLGGMNFYDFDSLITAGKDRLEIRSFCGDLEALAAALPGAGHHAIGLCDRDGALAIATTMDPDPLRQTYPQASEVWRRLDVAVAAHLIVEQICEPQMGAVRKWMYPSKLRDVRSILAGADYQLALIMQPTRLEAVARGSHAGELMPPKSTFFYPKLATGLVINPLESILEHLNRSPLQAQSDGQDVPSPHGPDM